MLTGNMFMMPLPSNSAIMREFLLVLFFLVCRLRRFAGGWGQESKIYWDFPNYSVQVKKRIKETYPKKAIGMGNLSVVFIKMDYLRIEMNCQ